MPTPLEIIPVVNIPDTTKLRTLDATTIAAFHAHRVTDDDSAAIAADYIRICGDFLDEITNVFAEPKSSAYKLHKFICNLENKLTDPANKAIEYLKKQIKGYLADQRQKAAELEANLRKESEEKRLAAEAEKDPWENDMEEYSISPITIAPPPLPAGIKTRKGRDSYKLVNIQLLIEAAAKNPELAEALTVNDQYLKAQSAIFKQTLRDRFPGVEYFCDEHLRY